jgi:hypothetical protein
MGFHPAFVLSLRLTLHNDSLSEPQRGCHDPRFRRIDDVERSMHWPRSAFRRMPELTLRMPQMLHFNISLTSLAVVLWSGMLIIAGSIWVLSSQVRKLVDLLEQQGKSGARGARTVRNALGCPTPTAARENVRRVVERATSRVN